MQIETKKDIEEAYKDELFKGFSAREFIAIMIALAVAVGVTIFCWRFFHVPIDLAVYISVPCILPFLAMGFFRIQGLSPWGYLKEIVYEYRTQLLLYDADEIPEHEWPDISMEREKPIRKKRKRGKKN